MLNGIKKYKTLWWMTIFGSITADIGRILLTSMMGDIFITNRIYNNNTIDRQPNIVHHLCAKRIINKQLS